MTETKPEIQKTVETKVVQAVQASAADPTVKMDYSAVPEVVDSVLTKILPIVLHSTNQEPWYQSRVFWSAILGLIAAILGLFGIAFPAEVQAQYLNIVMAFIPLAAALLAFWGRYAKTPLGTSEKK